MEVSLLSCLQVTSASLSAVLKTPQILAILSRRSVAGLSRTSLLIELWNFMMTVSYSAHFGYPRSLYAEYAPLILQDLLILGLVVSLSSQSCFPTNRQMIAIVVAAAAIHAAIAFHLVPSVVPVSLILTGLPSGIVSRVVQIREVLRRKDSGNLSAATWALAFVTTCCRMTANLLTVRDPILLFRVGSATALNAVLVVVIRIYRSKEKVE